MTAEDFCGIHRSILQRTGRLPHGRVDLISGRCKARVWNDGNGGQCNFRASGDLCGVHAGILRKQGHLPHGRMDCVIPMGKAKEYASKRAQSRGPRARQMMAALRQARSAKKLTQFLAERQQKRAADMKRELMLASVRRVCLRLVRGCTEAEPFQGFASRPAKFRKVVNPSFTFPFSTLRGTLSDELLHFLQEAPEWRRTEADWEKMKECTARCMGFEREKPAVEMYAHCRSQDGPCRKSDAKLYGRCAAHPAPLRLMAFRHAFVTLNGQRLRLLEDALVDALAERAPNCVEQFEQLGCGLLKGLPRSAFSVATMQLRWGRRDAMEMERHVDGGASVLHMSISLFGFRKLRCEVLGPPDDTGGRSVKTIEYKLGPGDVYISSPACCVHSVTYEKQVREQCGEPPGTLVIHLRSDLMRLRHGPSVFYRSNALMAEVVAPIIARHLAAGPWQLPTLSDLNQVLATWALEHGFPATPNETV